MRVLLTALVAAVCCLAATSSLAADSRVATRLFRADDVVVVPGRAGVQAAIAFGDQEQIENVAIGDSTSWQVTPNKRANLLFVKPLGERNRTNMTVVTDRHTYLFDLVATPSGAPIYILRFTYPPEAKPARLLSGAMSSEEAQAAAIPPKEDSAPVAQKLNFEWRASGVRRILPSRIYDDGNSTYMTWPEKSGIPAILTRNDKGEEGAVNYAVRGDVLVLDSVPKEIVLRSGREMATLQFAGETGLTPQTTVPSTPAGALSPSAAPSSVPNTPKGN
jgi:type IV secretion system protein VirB9